jgi:MFS family permease
MLKSQLWSVSQASIGIVQWIGIAILFGPTILERTGSGLLVGQAMLILGLSGLVAPMLGGLADKFHAHRPMLRFALLCHISALALLLYPAQCDSYYWLIALLFGLGSNLLFVLNPTFAVKLNPNSSDKAKSLKLLFQLQMLGVVIAGSVVGLMDLLDYSTNLQISALLILDICCFTILCLNPPAPLPCHRSEADTHENATHGRTWLLWLTFIFTTFISMFVGSNMVEMGPLIINKGFSIELSNSAFGMALSALVTIFALVPAGKWMERHGSIGLWLLTVLINLIVGVSIWAMFGHSLLSLLPMSLIIFSIINGAWNDISLAALADELSPMTPAATQGLVAAAISLGFAIGTFIVGWLFELNAVAHVMAFLAISGVVLGVLGAIVWLLYRKQSAL